MGKKEKEVVDLTKICEYCKQEYQRAKNMPHQRFCCTQCKRKYRQENSPMVDVVCSNCKQIYQKKSYIRDRYQNSYCCLECELEYKHKQSHEWRMCEICKTPFECKKKSPQKMCSIQCQGKWQSINLVGKNANNYNKEYSEEDRTIICEWCGETKQVNPYKIGRTRFCTYKCKSDWYNEIYSQSDERRDELRKSSVKSLEDGNVEKVNTGCQLSVNNILDELNINYQNEKGFIYYCVDNYLIDSNLIIEVMGTYWHCDTRFYPTIRYEHQKFWKIYNLYNI